ncbi:MAG: hypothetical protein AAF081_02690 [Actinomycetota bacterium]
MSLSDRLRAAALERARAAGQRVDDVVLEPTGVIDLRKMAREAERAVDRTVRLPRLDGSSAPTDGRDTSVLRRLRPLPGTVPEPTIDLRDQSTIDLTESPLVDAGSEMDEVITAPCGRCGGTAQRDLFERFSRTEYYSCTDCGHMWQQRLDG